MLYHVKTKRFTSRFRNVHYVQNEGFLVRFRNVIENRTSSNVADILDALRKTKRLRGDLERIKTKRFYIFQRGYFGMH